MTEVTESGIAAILSGEELSECDVRAEGDMDVHDARVDLTGAPEQGMLNGFGGARAVGVCAFA